jgi:hypothetical protein
MHVYILCLTPPSTATAQVKKTTWPLKHHTPPLVPLTPGLPLGLVRAHTHRLRAVLLLFPPPYHHRRQDVDPDN